MNANSGDGCVGSSLGISTAPTVMEDASEPGVPSHRAVGCGFSTNERVPSSSILHRSGTDDRHQLNHWTSDCAPFPGRSVTTGHPVGGVCWLLSHVGSAS